MTRIFSKKRGKVGFDRLDQLWLSWSLAERVVG
jgi:hypothetical protein